MGERVWERYRKLSAELDEFRKEKSVLIEMARPLFQMQDRSARSAVVERI